MSLHKLKWGRSKQAKRQSIYLVGVARVFEVLERLLPL